MEKLLKSKNYVQIPIYRVGGKRDLLVNEIKDVLSNNGFETAIDGGILTVAKNVKEVRLDGEDKKTIFGDKTKVKPEPVFTGDKKVKNVDTVTIDDILGEKE